MSQLLQLGHPQLRQPAQPVKAIDHATTRAVIAQLLTEVETRGGMGIAASQLGIELQIFIMCSHPNQRYPNAPLMPPQAVINPQIVWRSADISKDWEGCLSVPGLRGLVPRPQAIAVRYQLQNGQTVEQRYEDFLARLFQHEYDHLQGCLFIDRVESTLDLMSEQEWQRQIASQYPPLPPQEANNDGTTL